MLHSVSYLIQFLDRTSHVQVQTVESHLSNVKHCLPFMVKGQILCISEERKCYWSILLLNGRNDCFFCLFVSRCDCQRDPQSPNPSICPKETKESLKKPRQNTCRLLSRSKHSRDAHPLVTIWGAGNLRKVSSLSYVQPASYLQRW